MNIFNKIKQSVQKQIPLDNLCESYDNNFYFIDFFIHAFIQYNGVEVYKYIKTRYKDFSSTNTLRLLVLVTELVGYIIFKCFVVYRKTHLSGNINKACKININKGLQF